MGGVVSLRIGCNQMNQSKSSKLFTRVASEKVSPIVDCPTVEDLETLWVDSIGVRDVDLASTIRD